MSGQAAVGTRKRASAALFISVAFGTTAFVASITVAPLAGEDLSGSTALSGLPWTLGVLGTGFGSVGISRLMVRRGRAPGLLLGYALGAVGCAAAVLAMIAGRFDVLVVASMLMGIGNSANHLSRYAAADLYPAEQRASGLSRVVWAGTIGGVVGPAIFTPTGNIATSAGVDELVGPFVVGAIGCVAAIAVLCWLVATRPTALVGAQQVDAGPKTSLATMWRVPNAQTALITLAVAQTVMVLIMAMTPLHIRHTGHGLPTVGIVISAHVFGMYGFSPVSGRLTDRFGSIRVIVTGFVVIAASAVGAAAAPSSAGRWLLIPLLGLGFGWSLCFVAGSALLGQGLAYADRARLQGATDLVVWTSAAVAGLGSGLLVEEFGYAVLCVAGAFLVFAPIVVVTRRRTVLVGEAV
jgi:MFS family permease